MPRGREKQTPAEAKKETILKIQRALAKKREGLRFKQIKESTGLHQTTVSKRLKGLISRGLVEYDPIKHLYKIKGERGYDDLETRELVELITKSKNRLVTGGSRSGSVYPEEDLIMKSVTAYAFPGIQIGIPGDVGHIVHKYLIMRMIQTLAHHHRIDPRCLTGEKPLQELIPQLKKELKPRKQVLGFIIDFKEIVERLNVEYLEEILRMLRIDDSHGIVWSPKKRSCHMEHLKKYANEVSALEFIRTKGRAKLEDIAKHLDLNTEETRQILDNLLVEYRGPKSMEVYDKNGKFKGRVKLWPQEKEIRTKEGLTIKMKLRKSKAFLEKTSDDKGMYYYCTE